MLVLASVAVPSFTLVSVCACSCVGVHISYMESLKFEGGAVHVGHGSATVLLSQEVCMFYCVMSPGNIMFASS